MSLRNLKSARTMHSLDSLFSPALLSRFLFASAPAGLESVGDGEKSRTIMVVDDLLDERPYRYRARPPAEVSSRVRSAFINVELQRWHESDLLGPSVVGPAPYKRYMALSFVEDDLDAIPTGSQAVAEKLPVWEANARVVLAGARRWAQFRWGLL